MKARTILILTFILAFASCKGEYNNSDEIADLQTNNFSTINDKSTTEIITNKYFPVNNNKQQVIGAYPFPSDWYLGDDTDFSVFIQNPSGAKVFKSYSYYFTDYRSSKLNKQHKISGNAAAFKSIETLIKEDFIPFADSLDIKLTHQYEIPEVAEIYKNNSSLYFSLIKPKEETFKAITTEWLDHKGIKSIAVIVHHSQIYENETIWGYTMHTMEAPEANFETAKETFLYSLKNYKTCFQHIYEANKKQYNSLRYDNRYNCVYYTPKQERERYNTLSEEAHRTGMSQTYTFDEYLLFLGPKGLLTEMDRGDICNLKAYNKKEETQKHKLDSLYTASYIPAEENNIDYENWGKLSD